MVIARDPTVFWEAYGPDVVPVGLFRGPCRRKAKRFAYPGGRLARRIRSFPKSLWLRPRGRQLPIKGAFPSNCAIVARSEPSCKLVGPSFLT